MKLKMLWIAWLCLALPATIQARDFSLTLLSGGQVVADREFDPLAENDGLALVQVELGIELPELLEGFSLELGYGFAEKHAELYAGDQPWLTTGLELHGVLLSAAYRLPLTAWLSASARVGGSLDFVRLRLQTDQTVLLQGWQLAKLGVFGLLGLELGLPRNLWRRWLERPEGDPREGFTLGLRLEAGWAWRQALDYGRLVAPEDEQALAGVDPIAREPVDLGDLRLAGCLFRIGVFAIF